MGFYTCDTSTIISRKLSDLPDNFLFSAVVLLELMSSAGGESERRLYEALSRDYLRDNSLIVPNAGDWLLASKILYWLTQGRRRAAQGKAPKLKPGASQRMALDALIATSARRWRAAVITDNWDDFKAIQYYCKGLKLVKASAFFR
jgi:predicted nucleic acid-binding protein